MSLIRWNPTRELASWPSDLSGFQREMNRMFDNFFHNVTTDESSSSLAMWSPAADIAEHDHEYKVKMELPGVEKGDVHITLESNVLTVRGEKRQEAETKNQEYHRVERTYGSFHRSFTLPTTVQNERIEASFKDGILTITLPKSEEAKPKQIEVKVR